MFLKRRRRKGQASLEILALLLIALAITAVSAAVYNILYADISSVTVEGAKIQFILGEDSEAAGAQIGTNGTYIKFNSISGWPNATRIYTEIANIKNFDSSPRTISLEVVSSSGNADKLEYLHIKLFSGSNQAGSTIGIGPGASGSTGDVTISGGGVLRIQLEVKWRAGALTTDSVSLTLRLTAPGE
ncbi:MAG: hypothetical protein QXR40_06400 [Candidatus Bathyarchaeia archaeon]